MQETNKFILFTDYLCKLVWGKVLIELIKLLTDYSCDQCNFIDLHSELLLFVISIVKALPSIPVAIHPTSTRNEADLDILTDG